MEITNDILRALIKEEIEKSFLREMREEETDAVAQIAAILTRLDTEKMNADAVMDAAEKQFQQPKIPLIILLIEMNK
jgi:predicted RNA-binding protein